jgi:hypothetical protein
MENHLMSHRPQFRRESERVTLVRQDCEGHRQAEIGEIEGDRFVESNIVDHHRHEAR